MALYINERELVDRLKTGRITADGFLNGKPFNIYKAKGIDINELGSKQVLECVMTIVRSMESEGIKLYPREVRGSKLRDIRIKKGYRLIGLARKTGISREAIYRIEAGKSTPHRETLDKLATALGVEIEAFS